MKVLVTGASGFVGSAVVRAFLLHGHRVIGLLRNPVQAQQLASLGASVALGDMWRPETYVPLVSQVDAVIHAAQGKPRGRWSCRKIQAMHASDALMTRTLAESCLRQHKHLIYTSGALAHLAGADDWIDETTPLCPCLLAKGHADVVRELDDLLMQGLQCNVITPGFVYGPGSFLRETVDLLLRRRYRVIDGGTNFWSFVHVDDLAEAYVLTLERGCPGANYFVSDGFPLRRRETIDLVTDALGMRRVGGVPGWVAGLMLGFPIVEAVNSSIRMSSRLVARELGWQPRYAAFSEALPTVLEQIAPSRRAALKTPESLAAAAS